MGSQADIAYAMAGEEYESQRARGETTADAFAHATKVLRVNLGARVPTVPPDAVAIAAQVAKANGLPFIALLERNRHKHIATVRAEAAWTLHKAGYGCPVIAMVLKRDRTSMIVAVRGFEKRLATDELLRARVMRAAEGKAA